MHALTNPHPCVHSWDHNITCTHIPEITCKRPLQSHRLPPHASRLRQQVRSRAAHRAEQAWHGATESGARQADAEEVVRRWELLENTAWTKPTRIPQPPQSTAPYAAGSYPRLSLLQAVLMIVVVKACTSE